MDLILKGITTRHSHRHSQSHRHSGNGPDFKRDYDKDWVCSLHNIFLGSSYDWAGKYRNVDISSDQIHWCHAPYIEQQMEEYSKRLSSLTPLNPNLSRKKILEKLAGLHGELIVIRPFRDGNGRVTRLLCDLLLMQAEIEPIQKGAFYDKTLKQKYFQAIQKIWSNKDYQPLVTLLDSLVFP